MQLKRIALKITGGTILVMLMAMMAGARMTAQEQSAEMPLQDTLYVLDSIYVEVDLDQQEIYRHASDGRIDTFLCSTGNARLPRGIATRPGIFSIKWKAGRHVSSIFNVPMYYWMPFDGGIGFHSLAGDDYYIHLGYEPSSHGCVRMSNESAEDLFNITPVGTIVYVHRGTPARVLQFAAGTAADLRILTQSDLPLLHRRLDAVHDDRRADPALRERLALPRKFGTKIEVGEIKTERISERIGG